MGGYDVNRIRLIDKNAVGTQGLQCVVVPQSGYSVNTYPEQPAETQTGFILLGRDGNGYQIGSGPKDNEAILAIECDFEIGFVCPFRIHRELLRCRWPHSILPSQLSLHDRGLDNRTPDL
jgi:hypothetical protein